MSRPIRFAAAVIAAALIVGMQIGAAPPQPAEAAADSCIPAAVLTFRGSGEGNLKSGVTSNAGENHRYGTSKLVTNGWEGERLGGMLTELAKVSYPDGFKADSIPVIGVGPADSFNPKGYPAIEAWTEVFMQLNGSATNGANAAMEIMEQVKTGPRNGCATQTKFILAGYSQGVIAARMTAQMNPIDVIGVVSIGDPYQKPNASGNEGSGSDGNGFMRWNYPNLKAQMDTFYDLTAEKAAVCHDGDVICDWRWGTYHKFVSGDFADHESYYTSAYPDETKNKSRQIADIAHRLWKDAKNPPVSSKVTADVMFVIDTTGSMDSYIRQAIATAEEVASATLANAPGSRVGLVEYRDHSDSFVTRTVVPLTTDFGALTAGLSGLDAYGGGDWEEAVYSGIVEGLDQPWRTGVAKSIIVIGDAPAHDPEPVTGYTESIIAGYLVKGAVGERFTHVPPEPEEDGGPVMTRFSIDTPNAAEPNDDAPSSAEFGRQVPKEADPAEEVLPAEGADISAADAPTTDSEVPTLSPAMMAAPLAVASPDSAVGTAASPVILYVASADGHLDGLTGIAEGSGGRVLPMSSSDDLADAIAQALEETTGAPVASVNSSSPAVAGLDVLVSAAGSTSSDPALTYEFDIDGDGTFETVAPSSTVATTFSAAGTYTVSVRVTDSRSRASVATTQIDVAPAEAAEPVDPRTPGMTVTSDGTVFQGDDVEVTIVGGTPEEYLLVPGDDEIWETEPTFSAPIPSTWATDGLPVPATVPAGTYRLVVGAAEGIWGASSVQVLSNGSTPAGAITLSATTAKQGGTITVTGTGLSGPGSAEVWLHSDPVRLGSAAVSAAGSFRATVVIPSTAAPGAHSVVVNYGGASLTAPLIVTAANSQTAAVTTAGLASTGVSPLVTTIALAGLLLVLAGIAATRVRVRKQN